MTKTYTKAGFKALQDELDYLVNVRAEENKKEISTARSFGDLSENSEYDEAKTEQGKIHARIAELKELISHAKIIDETEIDATRVSIGSTVEVYNQTRAKDMTYHIVGFNEANPALGKISDASPVGMALMGAVAGDEVVVAGEGVREQRLLVKSVSRSHDL